MRALLRYFSGPYLRRHPVRVLLGVLSIALGVALFSSIEISRTSTEAAFRRTIQALSGRAQLQVIRRGTPGFPEDAFRAVAAVPGLQAAPVLELSTTVPGYPQMLLILGLDLAREASFRRWELEEMPRIDPLAFLAGDLILVTETFARRRSLHRGSVLTIDTATGPRSVRVGAIVRDQGPARVMDGNVAVMPLRTAQRLFRREGTVDRIEIRVDGELEPALRRLRDTLGADYDVRPPPTRNSFLEEALTRLRALMGISVVALLVGLFIIYNSVSISVVERLREIGTLRAMGATRSQIFGAILVEGAALGIAGSAAGLGLGIALAHWLLQIWTREVNQVTMIVDVSEVTVVPRTVAVSLVLGTLTPLVASFFPARAGMSITPVEMLRRTSALLQAARSYFRAFGAGIVSIGASLLLLGEAVEFAGSGLVASFLAFLGAALLMPQATVWASRAARPALRRAFRILGFLAADNVAMFPQRTALTVIALAGALAMMVSSTSLVQGIKHRSARWMDEALPFDCTVRPNDFSATIYANVTLPEDVPEIVRSVDAVESTYGVRALLEPYGGRDVMLFAIDMEGYSRMEGARGHQGFVLPGTLPDLLAGRGTVVSTNFAKLYHVKPGDAIELGTPGGTLRLSVLGAYEEYSWPQGSLFIDRGTYRRFWQDPSLSYLDIGFKPGTDPAGARDRIRRRLGETHTLFLYDVADLKSLGDHIMDNTQVLLDVQVALAILIGFFGIVNTLLISVMQRTREIGLLRAVGMTRGQVGAMILIESLLIATVGGVLGIALGLAGARWPLAFHVEQVSGYWLPLFVPWSAIGAAFGGALAIGAVASLLPARHASRADVLEAITYE